MESWNQTEWNDGTVEWWNHGDWKVGVTECWRGSTLTIGQCSTISLFQFLLFDHSILPMFQYLSAACGFCRAVRIFASLAVELRLACWRQSF
jgi:hypothetical protein